VIRFSAFLVVVAVGVLVAGVVTSKLLLVYIAIGVSGVALLALVIGAAVNWRELTGKPKTADTSAQGPAPVPPEPAPVPPEPVPAATAPAAAPAVATSGPSRAGYLPAAEPPRGKPAAAPASSVGGRPPVEEQVPADATDKAKLAVAAEPQPGPEPNSGIDPELTLFTGITPAASDPLAAPSKAAQGKQDEQDEKPGEAEPAGPDPSMEVTVVPGVPRYHNARCILIRFMGDSDLDKMTLAAARNAGCTPCRACLPDEPEKSPE
jgi:cytoskeletal protein RodZ